MAKKKKRKKPKTIGEMTQSRGLWSINPVTKIKESKKAYDRKREKQQIRKGDY